MPSPLLAVLGPALVALVLVDALWTTVAPRGAGPVAGRIGRGVYAGAKALGGGRAPGWTGPTALVAAFLWWVGALWLGWWLVYSADPGSIVDPKTGAAADAWSRAYVVGTYLTTLGLGALWAPGSGVWGVVASAVALNGFAVVTLVVTYVLQVVGAVTGARQLAGAAHALGETPQAVVTGAWTGSGFDGLATHLANLVPMVEAHGRRHEAYPALHFFQSRERRTSAPTMLAVLDEALLLLADGVAPEARLAPAEVEPLRRVLAAYLDTLSVSFVDPADEAPEAPSLAPLATAGVPTVEAEEFERAVEDQRQRRRCLLGLVRDEGREWNALSTVACALARHPTLMEEAAVFDSNAYRNLGKGQSIEEARKRGRRIAEREAEVDRRSLCHPWVAAELLAHLADPDDPALPHCHRAVAVLAHHCGGDGSIRFLPPPEVQLGRSYYGREDTRARPWMEQLGAFCALVAQTDDPADFNDDMRRDFATIADGVERTETQFVQDMFDRIVKAGDPTATSWQKVEDKETRRAVLKLIDSDDTLLMLAVGEIQRAQIGVGAEDTPEEIVKKAKDLAARFPVPMRFYREVVRRIVMGGSDMTKKNRANMIWDKEIAFYLGETPVTGIGPVRLVTNDGMIVDIAEEAGVRDRVDRIGDYLDRIGLADEIQILVGA